MKYPQFDINDRIKIFYSGWSYPTHESMAMTLNLINWEYGYELRGKNLPIEGIVKSKHIVENLNESGNIYYGVTLPNGKDMIFKHQKSHNSYNDEFGSVSPNGFYYEKINISLPDELFTMRL